MKIVQTHSEDKSNLAEGSGKSRKESYLELHNCALLTDVDTGICVDLPRGREDYSLFYLVDGTMYFELGGKKTSLGAGNLLLFGPGEKLVYGSFEDEPVSFYRAYFSGTSVPEIFEDCGFSTSEKYFIDVESGICKAINMIIKENTYGEYCYTTRCNSLFIMLFAEMAKLTDKALKSDGKYGILLPALKAMEQNYKVWYQNEDYAKMCGISKYHFIHLFTECKGCSPSKYKSDLLMQKAGELVGISKLSMNEIAQMLGFEDPLYFSKKFRAYFGVSPSAYRKNKGEQ